MSDVTIETRTQTGMVTIRADLSDPALKQIIGDITGLGVPATRRITLGGEAGLAWMSPDELLWFTEDAATNAARLAEAFGDAHALVVDVSDARARFAIEGPGAREVLAKGAPIDVAPQSFTPGDFRRTRLGQVAVACWVPMDDDGIELVCFRSVAAFVASWLDTAARPGTLPGILPR